MTRDSIPGLDLYRELEVSRQASVAAIEAAYRRLVKEHHPDVARSADFERIKRLNLAREWLTDLDRRRQYDVSRGFSPTSMFEHGTSPRAARAATAGAPSEPVRSFGVNANDVRIFLAGLRGLDSARARRVFDGRAVATTKGLRRARRAAAEIGQAQRKDEWLLAREAASVIARGKLGETTLTEQVVDVIADAAGAIAIRDLLTPHDFNVVMLPWTWTSARVAPVADPAPRRAAPTATAAQVGKPIEARPTPFMLAGAAPDSVPAERWAEAFGTRWPPPREPVSSVATVASVARVPEVPSPVASQPAPVAPVASEPAPGPPVASEAAPASPVAAERALPIPEPARPIEAAVALSAAAPSAAAPAPSPAARAASAPPASAAPATPVATPVAVSAPRAAAPTPSRISIADLGASPWSPRSEPEPKPVKFDRAPQASVRASARPTVRRPIWIPVAAMLLAIIAIGGVVAALSRPPSELDVAAITDDPLTPTNEATGFVVAPASNAPGTEPASTDPDTPPPDPPVTDRPGGGPTPAPPPPGPDRTPKPTPKPPPAPTTTPATTPAPTPTPGPTPTPEGTCLVMNLINHWTQVAEQQWAAAGFTGTVTFDPVAPPNYKIKWQSLAAGSTVACTSGIVVRDQAP